MASIQERGAVRWAIEGDELVIYVDADELADTDLIDVPEVALVRIKTAAIKKEAGRAWDNIKAEGRRFVKRIKKAAKK